MKVSQNGIDLIKELEGFSSIPYTCAGGVLTIGYGTTVVPGGLTEATRVTREEAEELLAKDLEVFSEAVLKLVRVPLTQNQFDALVCFVYNVGVAAFGSSTLLRVLNQGKYLKVPSELKRWNKANGRVLPGLVRRREAESELFTIPDGVRIVVPTFVKRLPQQVTNLDKTDFVGIDPSTKTYKVLEQKNSHYRLDIDGGFQWVYRGHTKQVS